MLSTLIFVFVCLQLSQGIPLESPSELSRYFPRIVGGEEAPPGLAPHSVALVISEYMTMLVCGGSLVSARHVLTAAHCIDMFVIWGELLQSYHAVLGTNDWYHKGIKAQVSEFHIHPQWNMQHIKYDLGLLVLKEKAELNDKVAVIGLNYDLMGAGEDCLVAGWGRKELWGVVPYKMQYLHVKTLSPKQCEQHLLGSPVWGSFPPTLQADIEICTFKSEGKGMCNGDSGSALVQVHSGKQIGVVSWGYPCAMGLPDVFVRLSGFRDYIESILSK